MNDQAKVAFHRWFQSLKRHRQNDGPAKGTLSAALIVLERLRGEYDLSVDVHTAKSGTQIRGASGKALRTILERFGEVRKYSEEAGRTNRGARAEVQSMLTMLKSLNLAKESASDRDKVLADMQKAIVVEIQRQLNRGGLRIVYHHGQTTWAIVADLLMEASRHNKAGPVAEYLVGAKLALRFPEFEIRNTSFSTSDDQTGQPGDFLVGDTAFHVTVAPQRNLYLKCEANLDKGLRVYVLVPDFQLEKERKTAEATSSKRITVRSIESFVSQNIDELSSFSEREVRVRLRELIETYNHRVREVENDTTLLIDIPRSLEDIS